MFNSHPVPVQEDTYRNAKIP